LPLRITPTNAQERNQVAVLAEAVKAATAKSDELAVADQRSMGVLRPAAGEANGIQLEVVKLPDARRGFVVPPRRGVAERSFA
jgi:hypothetical protein